MILAVFTDWSRLPWEDVAVLIVLVAVVGFFLFPKAVTRQGMIHFPGLGCAGIIVLALVAFVFLASFVAGIQRGNTPDLCPTGNTNPGCTNHVNPPPLPGSLPMPTLDGERPDGTMPTPSWMASPTGRP